MEATQSNSNHGWEPKIVVYLCNWCATAAADLSGVTKADYPADVSFVTVPCVGVVNPILIVKTLQKGADGVVVIGCNPGDCHHLNGNYHARRKFALLKNYLSYLGIEPERIQFSWVSGSEGHKFSLLLKQVVAEVREIGAMQKLVKKVS